MAINERINAVYKDLLFRGKVKNKSDFASKLGYNNSYISELISGKKTITQKIISVMEDVFDVDPEYLEGRSDNMFLHILRSADAAEYLPSNARFTRDEAFPLGPIDDERTEKNKAGNEFIALGSGRWAMKVPLVEQYAYGGYLVGYKDAEFLENLPKHSIVVTERHRGQYMAFVMRGDSMDDGSRHGIAAGDIVVGRIIQNELWGNSKLHLHKYSIFIIVHMEGILVKEIINHDVERGTITIRSLNPDKKSYPDAVLNLSEVRQLMNVTQITRTMAY